MAMAPFFHKCPHIAAAETRTIIVKGTEELPDGEYGFIEFYCDDLDCDCRRVLIQVYSPTTGSTAWATINYGWETDACYRKWGHMDDEDLKGPMLDPINPQSPYADVFLEFFKEFLLDKKFVARLKRHYALFRKIL